MTKPNATPEDLATHVLSKLKNSKIGSGISNEVILKELFKILFYTSLKTEEGQHIQVTVTLIDPDNSDPKPPKRIVADRWELVRFKNNIPFTVKNLLKLSKAADVWSSSLAIYFDSNNELFIWGMIDQAVHYHRFLNYESDSGPEQPGVFQSTITGIGSLIVIFDYELIATLKQDVLITNYIDVFRNGEIKEHIKKLSTNLLKSVEKYVNKHFPDEDFSYWDSFPENIIKESLSRVLLKIQNYQHGGALLITKDGVLDLDVKYPISYNRLPDAIEKVTKLTINNTIHSNQISIDYLNKNAETVPVELYLDEYASNVIKDESKDELKGAIRFIASLSCVDGLVLMDNDLNVKGFGTVIKMANIPKTISISKTATINISKITQVDSNSFGTRHRSMFSYCWNHSGSIGFVISQDGDIRAITKVGNRLVMWENIKVQRYLVSKKLKRNLPKQDNNDK